MNRPLLALLLVGLFTAFACQRVDMVLTTTERAQTDDESIRAYFVKNGITNYTRTSAGTYVLIDSAKPDEPFLRTGDFVYTRYHVSYLSDSIFVPTDSNTVDSSDVPFLVELGTTNSNSSRKTIYGWDDGLHLFRNHEVGRMFVPSGLAYGATGSGNVPPNAILYFDIKILDTQ